MPPVQRFHEPRMDVRTFRASGRFGTGPRTTWKITPRGTACLPAGAWSMAGEFPTRRPRSNKGTRTSETGKPPIRFQSATCQAFRGSCTWSIPFRFFKTPDHIAMTFEWSLVHRLIYTDGEPQRYPGLEFWMGDSRGRWEGDTLVVDVTGHNNRTWFDMSGNFHSEAMRLVERYTMLDPDTIEYEATIEDPQVFTGPWTIRMPIYRHKDMDGSSSIIARRKPKRRTGRSNAMNAPGILGGRSHESHCERPFEHPFQSSNPNVPPEKSDETTAQFPASGRSGGGDNDPPGNGAAILRGPGTWECGFGAFRSHSPTAGWHARHFGSLSGRWRWRQLWP